MKYLLTDHAKKRIAKRQIRNEWMEETLVHPARIESDRDDPSLVHVLRPIADRGFRVLRSSTMKRMILLRLSLPILMTR